jgi:hypothetical protein
MLVPVPPSTGRSDDFAIDWIEVFGQTEKPGEKQRQLDPRDRF